MVAKKTNFDFFGIGIENQFLFSMMWLIVIGLGSCFGFFSFQIPKLSKIRKAQKDFG